MSVISGKSGAVKLGANAVAEVVDFAYTMTMPLVPSHSLADLYQEFLPGRRGITGSVTCRWDDTDTNGQTALRAAILAATQVTLDLLPEGAVTGDYRMQFAAWVQNVSVTIPEDHGPVMSTFDFTSDGTITQDTV